ncbi:RES family NAD+ phosphorylase [Pollutimonas bauzanensis]|uniref:RES domain-containing protein n=1 Tax=Pollutimonas bauzanensis TaxID=658167 RepID=A0A1M5ZM79_9BURK|nr:RES family NAD+ phosphorylase [Pollutimonas bauzanensis]SHI25262.1 RES domain-containing protein [Pollutimonas bauzanensis]
MQLWRLCNGAEFWSNSGAAGRWHPAGHGVIVLDATPVAAICAALEFAEVPHPGALPATYRLHQVCIPTNATMAVTAQRRWRLDLKATRAIGQAWLEAGESPVLCVPALSGGHQYLLNTAHPDCRHCRLDGRWSYPFGPGMAAVEHVLQQGSEWLAVLPQLLEDTVAPSGA